MQLNYRETNSPANSVEHNWHRTADLPQRHSRTNERISVSRNIFKKSQMDANFRSVVVTKL